MNCSIVRCITFVYILIKENFYLNHKSKVGLQQILMVTLHEHFYQIIHNTGKQIGAIYFVSQALNGE